MYAQNFDVQGGIVNGSCGILKKIRYRTDIQADPLPHLPPNHFVALEDTVDMTFTHPYSKKKCLIKRTQLPILPAFAMTVHKAQGKTVPKAVIDLGSCRGTESPQNMLPTIRRLAT